MIEYDGLCILMTQFTAYCDAVILTGDATIESHALLARGGEIVDLVGTRHVPADAHKVDCRDMILAPGLIDAQVNGGGGILFNADPSSAACLAIAEAHRRHGTTALLPTVISDKPGITARAFLAMRDARTKNASILGLHLEGPHLSDERRGVHDAASLCALNREQVAAYKREGDEVLLSTLAPERAAPELIAALRLRGIVVSIGHTAAPASQIHAALAAGATGFTHLYNGMPPMTAREPGPAGVALDDADSWCGIIADGHHVAPEMLRVAFKAKLPGKIFLVSDAMPPAGEAVPKPFDLYGQTIHVERGRCVTPDGKLAGAAITLLDAVKYCVQTVGIELDVALRMASTNVAAFLGLDRKYGKLLPGYRADVIALDQNLHLKGVWVGGVKHW